LIKKKQVLRRGVAAAVLIAAGLCGGGFARAESLNDAMSMAYTDNPTLRAARAELRGVDEGVAQAKSGWRPNVEVNGGAGVQYTDSDAPGGGFNDDTFPLDASLDVVQPLYTGGRTDAQVLAAEKDVEAQRQLLVVVEQQVMGEVVTSYMNVWSAEAVLRLTENNERVLRRQLEATRDRFQVGETTRTDVAQADARVQRAVSDRVQAEGDLAAARATYEQVVGTLPGEVENSGEPGGLPSSQDEAVEGAVGSNPNVLASIFVQQAADARVDASESEMNPEVNLVGGVGYEQDQIRSDTDQTFARLIARLVIPLYQQGFVASQVRENKQISTQRQIEIEETRRVAKQRAIAAWEALLTRRSQVQSLQSEVQASTVALEGVRQENLVGARTVLDVLDAEQELLTAQVLLVNAQRDVTIASYGLLAAVGRLTAQDLGLPVEIYDPARNYDAVADKWYGTDIETN
jgi:outer membrane protein